jgi:hypothetical protein
MLRSQKEVVDKGRNLRQVLFKLHSLPEEASELQVVSEPTTFLHVVLNTVKNFLLH